VATILSPCALCGPVRPLEPSGSSA
jgi:hypothetical protein